MTSDVPFEPGHHHERPIDLAYCLETLSGSRAYDGPPPASDEVIPFGTCKGKTLGAVARMPAGPGYLRWLSEQGWVKPGLRRKIRECLSGGIEGQ